MENQTGTELRRDLGTWPAMSIVVGTVIGSGIFLVPRTMIQRVGTVEAVFAVWIVGGLLSLAGALSYAELAAAIPEAGGEYAYLREAYGPMWGFLYSWTQLWVAKSGSIATLGTGFFLYLTNFFPSMDTVLYSIPLPIGPHGGPLEIRSGQLFAIVLILLLAWLNYYGVKLGGNVQVAVTAVKVGLIGFVIIAGIGFGPAHAPTVAAVTPLTFSGFIAALVAALWAYDGWNNVSMVSSEIRDPQRNLPLALIGGTLGVIVIYLLANIAYFHVMTPAEVAGGTRVAADMMRKIMDGFGANAVSIAAMISIFAALNGSILSGARVPYAAARQGLFFQAVGNVSPKHHTPGVSIIVLTLWACLLVLSGRYDDLFNLVIFASWILYGMTAAAVIVLRKKQPGLVRPYRTLGYPVVPLLFVIGALILLVSTAIDRPRESGMGICLILAGLPFYFYWKKRRH
ncbi:MAG TPA: amino acid permease [Candidatus Sulfopaludibacter sp.]|jgi:APA family basic amino acid/polyamine antiporter|nr:amino acid permease [Candidatus Sulfopaludibacter sp.]